MSDRRDPNRETQAGYDERVRREIEAEWDAIDSAEDHWDGCEPTGSCDQCDVNLYPGDDFGGLCSQCAWWEAMAEGDDS